MAIDATVGCDAGDDGGESMNPMISGSLKDENEDADIQFGTVMRFTVVGRLGDSG